MDQPQPQLASQSLHSDSSCHSQVCSDKQGSKLLGLGTGQPLSPLREGHSTERTRVPRAPQVLALQELQEPRVHWQPVASKLQLS